MEAGRHRQWSALINREDFGRVGKGRTKRTINHQAMGFNLGRIRSRMSLRQQGILSPLSRFPLRGQAGAGQVPPTPRHVSRQQTALARSVRRLPPQEGFQNAPLKSPLRDPPAGLRMAAVKKCLPDQLKMR